MPIFEANLEFVGTDKYGHSFSIVYESDSRSSAIDDAYRWVEGRIRNSGIPEIFGFLGACKVSPYPIGRVQKDGSLMTGMQMWFHEWKYDWYPSGTSKEMQMDRSQDGK